MVSREPLKFLEKESNRNVSVRQLAGRMEWKKIGGLDLRALPTLTFCDSDLLIINLVEFRTPFISLVNI